MTCHACHTQEPNLGNEDGKQVLSADPGFGWKVAGLTLSIWEWKPFVLAVHFLPGTLPKSILRAQPDTVISKQTNMTFLCEGMKGAKDFHIYKDGVRYSQLTQILLKPENKAEFSISNIDQNHAGRYQCCYQTHDGWSDYSDTLELVVTGERTKILLSSGFPVKKRACSQGYPILYSSGRKCFWYV